MDNPAPALDAQPLVAIIILNWNGLQDTLECLQSLRASTYRNFRIWVLDNGSREDPSVALADFPEITMLRSPDNLGFAGGNNYVAALALADQPDYLLLLNNDTVVPPNMISELVRAHQRAPQAGLVAGRQLLPHSPEGTQRAGARWDPLSCRVRWEFVDPGEADEDIIEFDVLSGCTLLVPREVTEQVGLFDQRFFAYWEDTDLSLRVRQAGYRNYCAMKAIVIHKAGRSTAGDREPRPLQAYLLARGWALMARKHARGGGRIVGPLRLMANVMRALVRMSLRPTSRSFSVAQIRGFCDGWLNRPPYPRWFGAVVSSDSA